MTIESIDFFYSAQKEITQDGEIHSRNAISRAYYSAYHSALPLDDIIPNHPGMKDNVGIHEQFITKLINCPSKMLGIEQEVALKIKSLGVVLKQAKTARIKADYTLSSDVEKGEAESQLALTEKIFEKISEVTLLLSSYKTTKVKSI